MNRKIYLILIYVFISLQILNAAKPEVVRGKINLEDFDFKTHGIVKLNGYWQFYVFLLFGKASNFQIINLPAFTYLLPPHGIV